MDNEKCRPMNNEYAASFHINVWKEERVQRSHRNSETQHEFIDLRPLTEVIYEFIHTSCEASRK